MAYIEKKLIISSIGEEDEYEVYFNEFDNLIIQTKNPIGSSTETFICLSDEDTDALKKYLVTKVLN